MNIIGYTVSLCGIVLVHVLITKFLKLQGEQKELLEHYRNKLNPKKLDYDAEKRETHQKYTDFKDYDYKGYDISKIQDSDGYDLDTDYDLLKEDLLKYVNGANNYFEVEDIASPVTNEKQNITLNHNAPKQPLTKKENQHKGIVAGTSLDNQYRSQWESNNTIRNGSIAQKTLKPDLWTYQNEKVMNGGSLDSSGLMPFDSAEETNYVLL